MLVSPERENSIEGEGGFISPPSATTPSGTVKDAPPCCGCSCHQQLEMERENMVTLMKANNVLRQSQVELVQRYRQTTMEHAMMIAQLEEEQGVEAQNNNGMREALERAAAGLLRATQRCEEKDCEIDDMKARLSMMEGRMRSLQHDADGAREALKALVTKHETLRGELQHERRLNQQLTLRLEGTSKEKEARERRTGTAAEPSEGASGVALPLGPMQSLQPMMDMVATLERLAKDALTPAAAVVVDGSPDASPAAPNEEPTSQPRRNYNDEPEEVQREKERIERQAAFVAAQTKMLQEVCESQPELRCALERLDAIGHRNQNLRAQLEGVATVADTDEQLRRSFAAMHKSFWHSRAEEAVRMALHWKQQASPAAAADRRGS